MVMRFRITGKPWMENSFARQCCGEAGGCDGGATPCDGGAVRSDDAAGCRSGEVVRFDRAAERCSVETVLTSSDAVR